MEELELAPAGQWVGIKMSPMGGHAAVLAMKGSRFVVYLDGDPGPKIDGLLSLVGQPYFINVGTDILSRLQEIPVIFSDDGEHSAYFGKAGSEYISMRDG